MLKLLIDTSVWLDLAKDYRNLPLLTLLGDLVERDEAELLVPEVVREEFARNRARVLASAKASQGEVFKRARNAVRQFGNEERKAVALRELDDVAHSLAIHGEASNESMQLSHASFQQREISETRIVRNCGGNARIPPAPERGEHGRWHSGQSGYRPEIFVPASVESLSYRGVQNLL